MKGKREGEWHAAKGRRSESNPSPLHRGVNLYTWAPALPTELSGNPDFLIVKSCRLCLKAAHILRNFTSLHIFYLSVFPGWPAFLLRVCIFFLCLHACLSEFLLCDRLATWVYLSYARCDWLQPLVNLNIIPIQIDEWTAKNNVDRMFYSFSAWDITACKQLF